MGQPSFKIAYLKIPVKGVETQGETISNFQGQKDFISISGPEDFHGKPYITVYFWKKVGTK